MMKVLLFFSIISILTCGNISYSQGNTIIKFDCQDSIPVWLAKNKVPVLGIGIIENSRITGIRIYGHLDNQNPAPENTIFNVASLTKPVVAITVLKLVGSGQWDLDEPLSYYWIDPDIRDNPWCKKLTTRIILSHQTGFPNWRDQTPSKRLIFNFEPGTRFGYSGEGYEYLRRALESKFGKSLQELSDSIIFKPLGMKDTRYSWDVHMDSSRFAMAHKENGEVINRKKITEICAADWLVTSVEDYSKFGVYVLQKAGLSNELFDQMVTARVRISDEPGDGMGLGWEVIKELPHNEFIITHTGHDWGVSTLIILFPQSNRGIVMMTNGDSGFVVISAVAKAMLHMRELNPYLDDL
jgi:CubicO group peptidase (beta-lactamase class C family)